MKVLIVNQSQIPVYAYGGTERVIWDLARILVELGHEVVFLVPQGSSCDFAEVLFINPALSWDQQIPSDIDIVHFQFQPPKMKLETPYVVTEHGNAKLNSPLDCNTIFVSKDHAQRHGSNHFVYNGLDWRNYGEVDWGIKRDYYHFLGKAEWRLKNVKGAIHVAKKANVPLHVLGGQRFNFKRGLRLTFSSKIKFHGMVGGQEKLVLLQKSKGLIFPVKWHEPFGLAIIESMYFGCPIFATPYGAIPELVPVQCGKLSHKAEVLKTAIIENNYDPLICHQHVKQHFNAIKMANHYLEYYQLAISGTKINLEAPSLKETAENQPWFQ